MNIYYNIRVTIYFGFSGNPKIIAPGFRPKVLDKSNKTTQGRLRPKRRQEQ